MNWRYRIWRTIDSWSHRLPLDALFGQRVQNWVCDQFDKTLTKEHQ